MHREFGSEFDWDSGVEFIGNKLPFFQGGDYFRSGRDALKAIAKKHSMKCSRVLVPALCCDSILKPFKLHGYEIQAYKLKKDLTADYNDIIDKLKSDMVFLYYNYFGVKALDDNMLSSIRKILINGFMVEDRTHDIFIHRKSIIIADYTVVSIRKWAAIPDGGIIWSAKTEKVFDKQEDDYYHTIRLEGMKGKSRYLRDGEERKKNTYRLQFSEAERYLSESTDVSTISRGSYELIQSLDFKSIMKRRRENVLTLSHSLRDWNRLPNVFDNAVNSGLYYPIIVKDQIAVQKALILKQIYCPVIWPLPKEIQNSCAVSDYLAKHMLALPCDQRYLPEDMKMISEALISTMEQV